MDVSRCAPSVLYAYDLGALWVSGWMPGPRTPPGAQSCADTPTRVRAHRRANPVNETLSVQFAADRGVPPQKFTPGRYAAVCRGCRGEHTELGHETYLVRWKAKAELKLTRLVVL